MENILINNGLVNKEIIMINMEYIIQYNKLKNKNKININNKNFYKKFKNIQIIHCKEIYLNNFIF